MSNWKEDGWHIDGESWKCKNCGLIIGSNLKGDAPYTLVREHGRFCALRMVAEDTIAMCDFRISMGEDKAGIRKLRSKALKALGRDEE